MMFELELNVRATCEETDELREEKQQQNRSTRTRSDVRDAYLKQAGGSISEEMAVGVTKDQSRELFLCFFIQLFLS